MAGITREWKHLEKVMKTFEGRHASGLRLGWGSEKTGGMYQNAMFITVDLNKVSSMLGRVSSYKAAPPYLTEFLHLAKVYISDEIPKRAFDKGGLTSKWKDLSPSTVKHRAWLAKVGYNKHSSYSPLLRNSDSLFNTLTSARGNWGQKRSKEYFTTGGKYVRAFIEIADKNVDNEKRHGVMRQQNIADRFRYHMKGTSRMKARQVFPRNNSDLTSEDYTKIRKLFNQAVKNQIADTESVGKISRIFSKLKGLFKRK